MPSINLLWLLVLLPPPLLSLRPPPPHLLMRQPHSTGVRALLPVPAGAGTRFVRSMAGVWPSPCVCVCECVREGARLGSVLGLILLFFSTTMKSIMICDV